MITALVVADATATATTTTTTTLLRHAVTLPLPRACTRFRLCTLPVLNDFPPENQVKYRNWGLEFQSFGAGARGG